MANRQTNAARLREALRQWYVNSPPDPERERMRIAAERYRELIESPQRVGFSIQLRQRYGRRSKPGRHGKRAS